MTDSATPQFVLLPGLGADAALLEPLTARLDQAQVPDWPSQSARAYASSNPPDLAGLGAAVAADWLAGGANSPLQRATLATSWIGGISFGGMLAVEIGAALARRGAAPGGVFAISSCRSKEAVTRSFKLQQAMGRLVPRGLVAKVIAGPLAERFARKNDLGPKDAARLRSIASRVDVDFLRWTAQACAGWQRSADSLSELGFPVRQIHGRHDRVIPLRHGDPDTIVEDGKHLICFTHADQVAAWLRACAQ